MQNRNPTYDLQRHIITGEKGPLSGSTESLIRQADAELDRDDPMNPMTAGVTSGNFTGQRDAAIQQMNLTQALSMDSGDGKLDQQAIDMQAANDCFDEPSKGGLAYGPKNTGGY